MRLVEGYSIMLHYENKEKKKKEEEVIEQVWISLIQHYANACWTPCSVSSW
jgi:hypothetical protein